MSTPTTERTTIYDPNKDKFYLPNTVLFAIADNNGNYLDNQLLASDINILKNGKIASMVQDIQNNADAITALMSYEEVVVSTSIVLRKFGGVIKQLILKDATSDSNGKILALSSEYKPTTEIEQNVVVRGASQVLYFIRIFPNGDVTLYSLGGSPAPNVSSLVGTMFFS